MDWEAILKTALAAAIANQFLQYILENIRHRRRRKEDEIRQAFELSNKLIMLAIRYDDAIYKNELHNEYQSNPYEPIYPQEFDISFMDLTKGMSALDEDVLSAISEIDIIVAASRKQANIENWYESLPEHAVEAALHRMRACRDKCATMANRLRRRYNLPKLPKIDWEGGNG